jgi:hypothetical protein
VLSQVSVTTTPDAATRSVTAASIIDPQAAAPELSEADGGTQPSASATPEPPPDPSGDDLLPRVSPQPFTVLSSGPLPPASGGPSTQARRSSPGGDLDPTESTQRRHRPPSGTRPSGGSTVGSPTSKTSRPPSAAADGGDESGGSVAAAPPDRRPADTAPAAADDRAGAAAREPASSTQESGCAEHVRPEAASRITPHPGEVICTDSGSTVPAEPPQPSNPTLPSSASRRADPAPDVEVPPVGPPTSPRSTPASGPFPDQAPGVPQSGSWTIYVPWLPGMPCMRVPNTSRPSGEGAGFSPNEVTVCGSGASAEDPPPIVVRPGAPRSSGDPSSDGDRPSDSGSGSADTTNPRLDEPDVGSPGDSSARSSAPASSGIGVSRIGRLPARWPIPPQIRERLGRHTSDRGSDSDAPTSETDRPEDGGR